MTQLATQSDNLGSGTAMTFAPFSLVRRDHAGRVMLVAPVQWIDRRNLPSLTNAAMRSTARRVAA